MMYGWWDSDGPFPWFGFIFGPIMMIGFLALAVLVIMLLLRAFGLVGRRPESADDVALAILRERFARGEIDRAEYEDRKRILTGS